MCGIAGICGGGINSALVPSMLDIMGHRGPDAKGIYRAEKIELGHCRLSINDLSAEANQPFISKENNIAVAVNGEIYNFTDFRIKLEKKGYSFKSHSDSEIVIHAYIEYGLSFINDLNGMFAIAIWDGNRNECYLIRDRLGIKPLYYSCHQNSFIFASELKAITLDKSINLALDYQSFFEYLAFENYFSNRTLNKNIKMVDPGQIITFKAKHGTVLSEHYWQPSLKNNNNNNKNDLYARYAEIAESSVNRHLLSDVPLGCYLSSGIDSSSVAYWTSKLMSPDFNTYTGYFGMKGFYDESSDAKQIADHIGCSNVRVEITSDDFIDNIEKIIWHLDEPRVGMGSFSQYMVAKRASKDLKVILTGHGGDEFFAGYPVFKAILGKKDLFGILTNSSLRELMFVLYFSFYPIIKKEAGYFLPNVFSVKGMSNLLSPDFFNQHFPQINLFDGPESLEHLCTNEYERLFLTYLKFYLPALFVVEDKISMAFSLESRTPLCDNELLDFALSITLEDKLRGFELKHIPRTAMKDKLPGFVFNLPKRGFPTPLRVWFKNELKDYIRNYIMDHISSYDIFNRKEVEKIITKYQKSKISTPYDEILSHRIWILLNLLIYFNFQKTRYVL